MKHVVLLQAEVRLAGGNGPWEGTVEVYVDGNWGSICDHNFDLSDARVICRMLGYKREIQFWTGAAWGQGTGKSLFTDLSCSGNELNIGSCGYYTSNCYHNHDVGISCVRIRLVGGTGSYEGTIEININGEWGTICDKQFDINDANVICRMAGYTRAIQAFIYAYFGHGNGTSMLSNLHCSGSEDRIDSCGSDGWFASSCNHDHDAGVACLSVKLVGGNGPYEGTVELNLNGQWGTICGKTEFDLNDADVICRMAGYPRALQFYTFAHFGKGNGPIVLSNPQCSGKEDIIDDCGSNGWYNSGSCTHYYDAGVVCKSIRFVGGAGSFEGRVELNINGQWGTICDTNFDLADAEVLCRMAGYSRALQFFYGAYFGEGTGPVFLDRLGCSGNEKHLDSCSSSGLFATSCQHSHDIGLSCQSIRFADGAGPFEGRVELNINGQWGTICDKQFGLADAEVLCRMAGYSRALQAFVGGYFGEGTGPVFLENLGCSGNEKHLDSCAASGLFSTSCRHSHDVGVACLRVRLVDGFKQWEGRVELKVNGQWGTICGYNRGFDSSDATVVCRMAGFSTSGKIQAFQNAYFGRGTGPILLDGLNCVGHEVHLDSCISGGWYSVSSYCGHQYDVGVSCPGNNNRIGNAYHNS
ncbi:DMBT1 [Mytilus coruscus]|uniref:DMBT1 n=1 Tax=Mytilus coruscus TaxID=42192 RepID=A0A6J8C4A1_MYTCO|nr:DMBT1 [Mytilus coruscus]